MGIIGIVAAMTIPTLITNNQEKGWDVSASTFEAKFGQVLKVMNTQNTLAGLGSTENFVAELQRHMKINKVCDNSKLTECFTSEINGARSVIDVADATTYENDASKPTKTNTIKSAKELGQKEWNTNTIGLQFANGVSAIVAYNPRCSANPFNNNSITVGGSKNNITFDTDCVAMVYDVQAFKNPNELHKDIRTSSMASIEDSCAFRISGQCIIDKAKQPSPMSKSDCETIGKGLGIDNCYYDDDYWAGAVLACDGKQYMLTGAEMDLIGDYVFQNESRAIKLGLFSGAQIWGDAEYNYQPFPDMPLGSAAIMRRCLVTGYNGVSNVDDGNWGDRLRNNANPHYFCKSKS